MTMSVVWKKEFAIGVSEIDAQHQELFSRLDRLQKSILNGEGKDQLADTIAFLVTYTLRHFKTEEEFQKRCRYPHLAMHAAEHRIFEKELIDLEERLYREGPTENLANLTSNVLYQWLIQHICQFDKAVAGHFNKYRTQEWERWLRDNF
jgi:hemerythrin